MLVFIIEFKLNYVLPTKKFIYLKRNNAWKGTSAT